jgi:hemoglobin
MTSVTGRFRHIDDASIAVLVRAFYEKARADPVLGPVFEAAVDDWEAHFAQLTRFWSSVMLTSGTYKGDPVGAHRPHPIEPGFFARWLALWGETAEALFEPELAAAFRARAERIGESLRLALFFRP